MVSSNCVCVSRCVLFFAFFSTSSYPSSHHSIVEFEIQLNRIGNAPFYVMTTAEIQFCACSLDMSIPIDSKCYSTNREKKKSTLSKRKALNAIRIWTLTYC